MPNFINTEKSTRQMRRHFEPSPRARALATMLAIGGVFLAQSALQVTGFWIAVVLPLLLLSHVILSHLRFLAVVIAPLGVILVVVWWKLVGAPPGFPVGADPAAGLSFAIMTTARLATFGGIVQLCFGTIQPAALPATLKAWSVRGDALAVGIGAFVLIPEVRIRLDQVLAARLARGVVVKRGRLALLLQIPRLLRPLLAWTLRSAIQRAELWRDRELLQRVDSQRTPVRASTFWVDMMYILGGAIWCSLTLFHHIG